MEAYAQALLIAIPGFLVLMGIEMLYGYWKGQQTYRLMDTIASLSSGMTNVLKDSLGLMVLLVSYPYIKELFALQTMEATIWNYIIAFVCIDFASYWSHRLNHSVNLFWNQHIVHHSSEEFNLACALRQSISNILSFGALFLIPAAILGVPEKMIQILAPLHLFAQFWYHTKHIGKLGWLEYLLVTPSQHRVHHAINPIYIDKNLAAIFSIWDRLFGTFQEELEEEPPVYGTLKPVQSWNPFWINFQHFWGLVLDAWHTKDWKAKFTLWFRPTGWRPADVAKKYPRPYWDNVHAQEKYAPKLPSASTAWAIFHWVGTTVYLLVFLAQFGELSVNLRLLHGLLIFASIFGYTALMDKHQWAWYFEGTRILFGLLIFLLPLQNGGWETSLAQLYTTGVLYFGSSTIGLLAVLFTQNRNEQLT